jgi:molybdenum cofactor cytidylyltransferase
MNPRAVGAVILAAGDGRRMGLVAKALLPFGRAQTFLSALAVALRRGGVAGPIFVVTGAHRAAVAQAALDLGLRPVHNARYAGGQLGSARTGLLAALRARLDVVLLLPCDLPQLRHSTVRRLLAAPLPALPVHGGRSGHPLALDRATLERLIAVRGARSLRQVLLRSGIRPRRVSVSDPAVLQNLNTAGGYRRALQHLGSQANNRSRRSDTSPWTRPRIAPGTKKLKSSSRVSRSPSTR